jgi:putative oxidoreductase
MKHLPNIAGGLLGLLFVLFGVLFLFNLMPEQPAPAEGSPPALFMGAMMPTGYMTFVKILEVLGGLLVAIPKTRNFGLLVLGPIIVNILAFHVFLHGGVGGLFASSNAPIFLIVALAAYLLWVGRKAFAGLFN